MLSANFDRFLFAYTIGSHIIIVSASIALSLILAILEFMITRKNVPEYKTMLFKLKRMFIVSFGVGTASGIVLAVELVNLFPGFMTFVSSTGAISLFYAEVSAFFLETIALVIYVYYQDVFKWKYANFGLSILVALGVIMSAVFITMVNAWMNTPNGFNKSVYLSTGKITDVILSPPLILFPHLTNLHMFLQQLSLLDLLY
jgi:Cytochrome bd-type quinol oxidase, subunit 1